MPPHHIKVPGPRGWRGWRGGGLETAKTNERRRIFGCFLRFHHEVGHIMSHEVRAMTLDF